MPPHLRLRRSLPLAQTHNTLLWDQAPPPSGLGSLEEAGPWAGPRGALAGGGWAGGEQVTGWLCPWAQFLRDTSVPSVSVTTRLDLSLLGWLFRVLCPPWSLSGKDEQFPPEPPPRPPPRECS